MEIYLWIKSVCPAVHPCKDPSERTERIRKERIRNNISSCNFHTWFSVRKFNVRGFLSHEWLKYLSRSGEVNNNEKEQWPAINFRHALLQEKHIRVEFRQHGVNKFHPLKIFSVETYIVLDYIHVQLTRKRMK